MARLISFFDGVTTGTAPVIGNIVASALVQYANDAAYEASETGSPTTGNIYYNTTLDLVRYYNGTDWISIVDEESTQALTNKTISGSSNTLTNLDGNNVIVDAITNLVATNAQTAFAEHQADIDDLVALSGVGPGDTGLGTFTGTTIPDDSTIKEALQELETEVESIVVATAIDDLIDVDTTSSPPSNGDSLIWNSGSSNWVPGTPITLLSINDLTDVDTVTVPPSSGSVLTWDAGNSEWAPAASTSSPSYSSEVSNLSIATSVGSSALTIEVKTQAGANASGSDVIKVGVRDATGGYLQRTLTSSHSLVISSGSTLGQTSGAKARLFIYLIDNSGTLELAVSQTLYPDNQAISTTAEGGAGAADSGTVIYSTTARSNVNFRLVATLDNTQTTAGTWASAGSNLRLVNSTTDAVEPINIRYSTNTPQPVGNATSTVIDFEDSSFDSHNAVTTGASWRFTAPFSGTFDVFAQIMTTDTGNFGGTDYLELRLHKNGSATATSGYLEANFTGSTTNNSVKMIDSIKLLGGEYIDIRMYQTSGGSVPLIGDGTYNFVNIKRVGN
jgi:hypothetical protein